MEDGLAKRPEWAPLEADAAFTSQVMPGVVGGHDGLATAPAARSVMRPAIVRRRELSRDDYVRGIASGDRTVLARAITLIESNAPAHAALGQEVLQAVMERTGSATRVGITGVPGVGKSTTIEALGLHILSRGHRLAVLAVDPSSTITKGSILGDKTRMERLSREPNAFIRPSPSSGTLGGVTRKSRETLLLCEAFGFDVVLVETVGVGQSEVSVRGMVDYFLLLTLAGAGDELQGIKKGVMELADGIVVNKADGDNLARARVAKGELNRVLRFLAPATEGWETKAALASALTGEGIPEMWSRIEEFMTATRASGEFARRRAQQNVEWMEAMLEAGLRARFYQNPTVAERLSACRQRVAEGQLLATTAARQLLALSQEDGC